jgi:hypothetical protein
MKRFLQVCLSVAVLGASVSAWSAPAAPMAGEHPCKAVEEACKGAGFTKGGAPGKGLFRDCMKPLLAGQTVGSISVPADVLSACQAKMAAKMSQHGGAAPAMAMPAH